MKKVSVIVPVYNVENYLPKCLNSLVNQTLKDIEIIIVNDGTKDNSQIIIDDYKNKYPDMIKSIIKENGGQGSARNLGLRESVGEYIAYVDSDDFIELSMLEKLYNRAKETNSEIVVCGNYLVNNNYMLIKNEIYKSQIPVFSVKNNPNILFDKMSVWNKLYKAEFLKKLNLEFRSKKWYEDFDFSTIVLLNSKKITTVEEPLYFYVLREGSTMNNSNIKRNLEIIEAFDEILNYVKKQKIYKNYYEELEYLCILHVYIYPIVRVINSNELKNNKKEIIKTLINYIGLNFPNFKKNKYLKKHMNLSKKIIYWCINSRQYSLIKLLFKIKNRKLVK